MSFGEVMGLLIVMGGMVAVMGMALDAYKARMRVKEKQYEALAAQATLRGSGEPEATARLEARLRVLERIATDKTTTLSAEIEQLREPAN